MPVSKYNVNTSEKGKLNRLYKGVLYDSEMELRYLKEIIEPQIESGLILKYDRQVVYELLPSFIYKGQKFQPINYKSDFNVYYADGRVEVIDVKGLCRPMDSIKRKMLLSRYPNINFSWKCYSGVDGGWCEYEVVQKARAKRKKLKNNKNNKENT